MSEKIEKCVICNTHTNISKTVTFSVDLLASNRKDYVDRSPTVTICIDCASKLSAKIVQLLLTAITDGGVF